MGWGTSHDAAMAETRLRRARAACGCPALVWMLAKAPTKVGNHPHAPNGEDDDTGLALDADIDVVGVSNHPANTTPERA